MCRSSRWMLNGGILGHREVQCERTKGDSSTPAHGAWHTQLFVLVPRVLLGLFYLLRVTWHMAYANPR